MGRVGGVGGVGGCGVGRKDGRAGGEVRARRRRANRATFSITNIKYIPGTTVAVVREEKHLQFYNSRNARALVAALDNCNPKPKFY